MPRGRRSKKKSNKLDLQVVTLIIASILLGVLIYTNSGYIGEHLSPILGGIMGWIKYIIPVGTFAIAIFLRVPSLSTWAEPTFEIIPISGFE